MPLPFIYGPWDLALLYLGDRSLRLIIWVSEAAILTPCLPPNKWTTGALAGYLLVLGLGVQ